jgi:predicted  nucleic acid-binding Zn-ribbon protein
VQLQRTSGTRGPVNRTPESTLQADNLNMINYIKVLHKEQGSLNKEIKEQQEIIESLRKDLTDLRTKIRRARDFLDSM